MTLWAIQQTTNAGSTWLDYTTVRSTRRECWREYYLHQEGATPQWHAEIKRRRRADLIRPVKVTVKEV